MKKLTKNLFKGIVRNEMKKINNKWEIKNSEIIVSKEGLKLIQEKLTENEIRNAIKGLITMYLDTKYSYWKGMHYNAGPFESNLDLSEEKFNYSNSYPNVIYKIELYPNSRFKVNDSQCNQCGPAMCLWNIADNIGFYSHV